MSNKARSLIKETSATTGTGDYTLAGALSGFHTFASTAIVAGADTYVPYVATMGSDYEYGIGRLSASTTLQRVKVIESSNGDAAVSWGAGDKIIICARGGADAVIGRHNFGATTPNAIPTASDNYTQGYGYGSLWIATAYSNSPAYFCLSPGDSSSPNAKWALLANFYGLSFIKNPAGGYYDQSHVIADELATWSGGQTTLGALACAGYGARVYHPFSLVTHADDPTNAYTKTGVAQTMRMAVVGKTTNATPTVLYVDNDSSNGNVVIPPACTQYATAKVTAREPSTGDSKVWTLELVYQRVGTADAALIGTVTKTGVQASAGASAWDIATQFNNTLDSLEIKATGEASKTISWYVVLEIVHNGDGE